MHEDSYLKVHSGIVPAMIDHFCHFQSCVVHGFEHALGSIRHHMARITDLPLLYQRVYRIKVFLYVLLRDIEFSIDPNLVVEKKVK